MRQPHLKRKPAGYKIPFRSGWVSVFKKGRLFKYRRKEFASPIVQGDLILVGSDNGQFYAMKRRSGRKVWRFKAKGAVNSVAASDGERVFFGDDKGHLYALKIGNGERIWEAELGSEILTAPAIGPGNLFVATAEGRIAALRIEDGSVVWSVEHPARAMEMSIRGNSPPVLDGAGHLYVGFSDGLFWSLRTGDGNVVWEKDYASSGRFGDLDAPPVIEGERIYLGAFDGPLMAVSRQNGRLIWSAEIGTGVPLRVVDDRLVVADSRGHLRAIRKADGTELWSTKVGEGALTAPLVHKDLVVVGLSNSTMNFIDARNGAVMYRRFARKGISSDPLLVDDRLYYLSNGGRLYSLKLVN